MNILKKINLIAFSTIFCLFLNINNINAQKKAIEYNDKVLEYYTILDEQIAEFDNAIWDTTVSYEQLKKEYNKVIDIYNLNYKILTKIKPLSKDKWFHKSVVDFYDIVYEAMNYEFKKIMDFYGQEWNDSFGKQIEDFEKSAVDKIIEGEDNVIESQQKFADKYKLTLY